MMVASIPLQSKLTLHSKTSGVRINVSRLPQGFSLGFYLLRLLLTVAPLLASLIEPVVGDNYCTP